MGFKPLDIKVIEENAANVYEAIVVLAKRARQINEDTKIEFNQRLETIVALTQPAQHEDEEEPKGNPEQIKLSVEFEKREKSTEEAISELLTDKIKFAYKQKEETK